MAQNEIRTLTLGRRIALASVKLTLSSVLVRLLSLVSMPVLTHLLPPSAYGTAALAGTLISLVAVIALAGTDMSYIRAVHAREFSSPQAVESFAWRFALGSGMLAALAVFLARDAVSETFGLPRHVFWLVAVGIVSSIAYAMAQARARLNERYGVMSLANVAAGVVTTLISIGVAYWWRQDELPLILSMVAGYLMPLVALHPPPFSALAKASGLTPVQRRSVVCIGLAGVVTAPALWVISSSDRWFLAYFMDAHTVGLYSVGYNVAILGVMANNAVFAVWTPEAVSLYERDPSQSIPQLSRMTERIIAGLTLVWLAVTAAGGDIVRLFAAPVFHHSAIIIPFIASAVFFYGVAGLANTFFIITRQFYRVTWWWIGGAIACLLLNIALIPSLGMIGAALSQLCGFLLIALGLLVRSQQLLSLQLNWHRLGSILLSVILPATLMFQSWSESPLHSLIMKIPLGVLISIFVGIQVGLLSTFPLSRLRVRKVK